MNILLIHSRASRLFIITQKLIKKNLDKEFKKKCP